MSEAIIEKKRGVSPVWILPFIALCVGGVLLFKSYQNSGIDIVLHLETALGLTVNKTPVVFKGHNIGIVKKIDISPDLSGVDIQIEMKKDTKSYLVEDAKFWVETIEIEAGKITGIETLFSGSYIGFQMGASEKPSRLFTGSDTKPPVSKKAPGLHIVLNADALYSVQIGSGIYYKNVAIGTVQSYILKDDNTVTIDVFILPEYSKLVKDSSRFWNAGGVSITGSITDLKVHVASLASIIKGGIMMETHPALKDHPPAKNGQTFMMYEDYVAANYGIPMTLELFSGEGISEGATKVMYRGMKLGHVEKMSINKNDQHTVTATVLLDPRAEKILKSGTKFYIVKPEFSLKGIKNLGTLVSGTYITFVPGKGKTKNDFTVQNQNPPGTYAIEHNDGIKVKLITDDLGSLTIGSPVYYKNFTVGQVTDIELREKEDNLLITGVILKEYSGLVKTSSRFYNISGVDVKASLDGLKFQMGSLETIVAGGISFYTPIPGTSVKKDDVYPLYSDFGAAKHKDRTEISIYFADTNGLKPGTIIKYNGIDIGDVVRVGYEDNMTKIKAIARLDKDADPFLLSGTKFWMVRPEFSLTGTQHLDTIISGPYIALRPGKGTPSRKFIAISEVNSKIMGHDGLEVVLESDNLFSIKKGSSIFYRKIKVGEVVDFKLSPSFQKVLISAVIDKQYKNVVRQGTKFWNASGINVKGGIFSGISVSTESMDALMAGGLALATPDDDTMGTTVKNGHRFTLYDNFKDKWLKWSPVLGD